MRAFSESGKVLLNVYSPISFTAIITTLSFISLTLRSIKPYHKDNALSVKVHNQALDPYYDEDRRNACSRATTDVIVSGGTAGQPKLIVGYEALPFFS